jgi:iron complex outermembrane receptor protein
MTGVSSFAVAAVVALSAGHAAAQGAAKDSAESSEVSEVVVTGSFIAGTPEDSALPVNVIGSEEMQKQGSPSTVDLIKSIPAVSGAIGESNQFGAGQTTGSGNVNLRGLGAERTLVLLNGRRMAVSPGNITVDTNLIPSAAIGRVEVLKDGAAATYGSDAVAGVVNFITRKNLSGFEVSGNYSLIDGSDGDYTTSLAYGWIGDRADILLTAGYRHRSELNSRERSYTQRSIVENPQGGWSSFGSPGIYLSSANGGASYTSVYADPGCAIISGGPTCNFNYIGFDNLSEREEHYQLYGQINFDVTDTTKFHFEVLYAGHDVPEENSSPSYPPNNFPTSFTTTKAQPNGFYIPASNPGLQALIAKGLAPATAGSAGLFTYLAWRPLGVGGNGLYNDEGKEDRRKFTAYRVSGGLNGKFENGIGWDTALTYMEDQSDIATPDIVVSRMELALRGLGGFGCNPATGTPGSGGCLYFNPFSTGVAGNVLDGRNNPNYVGSTANSKEVLNYMFEDYAFKTRTRLFSADLVFNGDLPVDFGAGKLAWAAGGQYRWSGIDRRTNDLSNIAVTPCVDTPVNPGATCTAKNGAFSFFGPLTNYDLDYSVLAAFGELQMPILDNLNATFAIRYEDYSGNVGATTNPKVALKWQALDWLAFRASAGSTFRAPPQTQIAPSFTTSLAYTSAAGGYRAYDLYGNPNLKPEKANTINLGAIVQQGDFQATLDYWSFDFKGPIRNESGSAIVNALFPNGASATLPNNCANPAYAGLLSRVSFIGACLPANINRVRINYINGPKVKTSGLDFSANYKFRDVLDGSISLGVDMTYVLKYNVAETKMEGVTVLPATDYSGTMDYLGYGSQPKWKATGFAEYTRGDHNIRWTVRYIDGMTDTRGAATFTTASPLGKEIDAFITHDIAYRTFLPWDVTLTASVINVFDEEPPFARLDLSYDPFTANPFGRYYKLGVTKKF